MDEKLQQRIAQRAIANRQKKPQSQDSFFTDALARTTGGMARDLGTLTEVAGAEKLGQGMQQWGNETIEANPTHAESFAKDPLLWSAERVTEVLPYMVPMGVGAKVGSKGLAAGARATGLVSKTAGKKIATEAGKKLAPMTARDAARMKAIDTAGGLAGAGAAMMPFHTGEALNFQRDQGDEEDVSGALTSGAMNTALDVVPGVGRISRKIGTGQLTESAVEAVKRTGKVPGLSYTPRRMAQTAAVEGVTEGMQTANVYLFASPDMATGYERLSSPEGVDEFLYSIGAGAVGGGGIAGPVAMMEKSAAKAELERQGTPAVDPDTGEVAGDMGVQDDAGGGNPAEELSTVANKAAALRAKLDEYAAAGEPNPEIMANGAKALDTLLAQGAEVAQRLAQTMPEGSQQRKQVDSVTRLYNQRQQLVESLRSQREQGTLTDEQAQRRVAAINRVQRQLVDSIDRVAGREPDFTEQAAPTKEQAVKGKRGKGAQSVRGQNLYGKNEDPAVLADSTLDGYQQLAARLAAADPQDGTAAGLEQNATEMQQAAVQALNAYAKDLPTDSPIRANVQNLAKNMRRVQDIEGRLNTLQTGATNPVAQSKAAQYSQMVADMRNEIAQQIDPVRQEIQQFEQNRLADMVSKRGQRVTEADFAPDFSERIRDIESAGELMVIESKPPARRGQAQPKATPEMSQYFVVSPDGQIIQLSREQAAMLDRARVAQATQRVRGKRVRREQREGAQRQLPPAADFRTNTEGVAGSEQQFADREAAANTREETLRRVRQGDKEPVRNRAIEAPRMAADSQGRTGTQAQMEQTLTREQQAREVMGRPARKTGRAPVRGAFTRDDQLAMLREASESQAAMQGDTPFAQTVRDVLGIADEINGLEQQVQNIRANRGKETGGQNLEAALKDVQRQLRNARNRAGNRLRNIQTDLADASVKDIIGWMTGRQPRRARPKRTRGQSRGAEQDGKKSPAKNARKKRVQAKTAATNEARPKAARDAARKDKGARPAAKKGEAKKPSPVGEAVIAELRAMQDKQLAGEKIGKREQELQSEFDRIANSELDPNDFDGEQTYGSIDDELSKFFTGESYSRPEAREATRKAVRSGNKQAIYKAMVAGLDGKAVGPVLSWAKAGLMRAKIRFEDKVPMTEDGRPIRAKYDPGTDTITVYNGGEHPAVLLHEAVHAGVERSMAEAREIIDSGKVNGKRQQDLVKAYTDVVKLYADFKKRMPNSSSYGLTDPSEFMAEMLSNPDFRAEVQVKPPVNLWGRFVEAVRKLLGMKPTARDALHETFAAAQTLAYNAPGASYMPQSYRSLFHTMAGPAKVRAAYDAMRGPSALDKLRSESNAQVRKLVIGLNTRFHLVQRYGRQLPALRKIVDGQEQSTALGTDLNNQMGLFGEEHTKWVRANKDAAEKLWTGLELHSQFRLSRQEVHDVLAGKLTYGKLIQQRHADAKADKKNPFLATQHIRSLGKPNFDRMVTALRAVKWSSTYDIKKPRDQWTANDWGNRILDLSEEESNRSYDILMRQTAYRAFGDGEVYNQPLKDVVQRLKEGGEGVTPGVQDAVRRIEKVQEERSKYPYIPTHRTGDYFVSLRTVPEGKGEESKTALFMRTKTEAEAEAVYQQLLNDPDVKAGGLTPSRGSVAKLRDGDQNSDSVLYLANQLIEQIDKKAVQGLTPQQANDVRDATFQAALDMLPQSSSMKAYLHREGTPGWDPMEQAEGFVSHMVVANHRYANNKFLTDIEDAHKELNQSIEWLNDPTKFKDDADYKAWKAKIEKQGGQLLDPAFAGQIRDEFAQRFHESMEIINNPILDTLRAFTYNWQLAMSPGYLIANLTQPYVLTIPTLGAKYGFKRAVSALMSGYRVAARVLHHMLRDGYAKPIITSELMERMRKDERFNKQELDLIEHMLASGKVEFTLAKEAGQISQGAERRARMARFLSSAAHYIEVLNRLSSGLAAAELETERVRATAKKRGKAVDAAELTQRTKDISLWSIDSTQFNYERLNQPRLLGKRGVFGEMTPLFTVFLNYSINVMEMYARTIRTATKADFKDPAERAEARRAFAGLLMTTGSLAGAGGLPLMGIFFSAATMLSDDEDDADAVVRTWMANAVGEDLAYALFYGAPAAFGVNMQSRVGQHDIMPFTRQLTANKSLDEMSASDFMSNTSAALGTALGITNAIPKAYDWAVNGDMAAGDAMIRGLPAAIRGPAKAMHGYYDLDGNPIPGEGGPMDMLVQSVGFTPTTRHEQLTLAFSAAHREARLSKAQHRITRFWAHAIADGDEAEAAEWEAEARKWNEKYPQRPIRVAQAVRRLEERRAIYALEKLGTPLTDRQRIELQPLIDALKLPE